MLSCSFLEISEEEPGRLKPLNNVELYEIKHCKSSRIVLLS